MPEYRLKAAPQWRLAGRRAQLFDPTREAWIALRPWTIPILEGVARGATMREMTDALIGRSTAPDATKRRIKSERRVKKFLFSLSTLGLIDIELAPPPATFADRYDLVKELGRGGVGVAYLCRDARAGGREVVVKRAWDFLQPYRTTEAALRREADVLRACDHEGIVRLLAEFDLDGHRHVVREYVRGEALQAKAPVTDPLERRRLAAQAADAIAHLHERGHVLIDLRPANFLVEADTGRVRLMDVGQARAIGTEPLRFPRPVGSAGFMPPEMEAGRTADRRSDVWGLGRLLSFLGTGQRPSKSADAAEAARRSLPEDAALVRTLCADDPAARPATAREAAALLRGEQL